MKIYLVWSYDYEADNVVRAFKDKERADEECVRLESAKKGWETVHFGVEEIEVE